jgi:tRNA(Ile)-lysidine synthase
VRYRRFREVAEAEGAARVAVAHHREDQAETLLLRLFRGTGPVGLAGMQWMRPLADEAAVQLIRPLLTTSQAAVHAYADEHGLAWREDPTNTGGRYARARLRTEVLPAIESAFPGATGRIAHAADLLGDVAAATLEPERQSWYDRIVRRDGRTICLDESALQAAPRVWAERVVLDAIAAVLPEAPQTSAVARSVYDLLDSQVGTCVELAAGVIWRERGALRLVPERAMPVGPVAISAGEAVETPYGTVTRAPDQPREAVNLSFEPSASPPDAASASEAEPDAVAVLDADQLPDPLTVRTWQEGDRLQPLGMRGTKTVADVLTDAQIPPHRRARTLVVVGPEHVVWIPGVHLDHRQRIRPQTERVTRFTFTLPTFIQPDSDPGESRSAGSSAGRTGQKGLST